MFESIDGIPLHPLLVHAPVILIPLAVLIMIAWLARPAWRSNAAWTGAVTLFVGATLLATLLAGASGEELVRTVRETAIVERHEELAEVLESVVWAFALSSLLAIALARWGDRLGGARRLLAVTAAVAVVTTGAGSVVMAVLTGHAGAKSAWSSWSPSPADGGGGDGDED